MDDYEDGRFRRPGQGTARGDAGSRPTRPCANCSLQPGYLRIEKPLMSYDEVYVVDCRGAGADRAWDAALALAYPPQTVLHANVFGTLASTAFHAVPVGCHRILSLTTIVNRRMPTLTLYRPAHPRTDEALSGRHCARRFHLRGRQLHSGRSSAGPGDAGSPSSCWSAGSG